MRRMVDFLSSLCCFPKIVCILNVVFCIWYANVWRRSDCYVDGFGISDGNRSGKTNYSRRFFGERDRGSNDLAGWHAFEDMELPWNVYRSTMIMKKWLRNNIRRCEESVAVWYFSCVHSAMQVTPVVVAVSCHDRTNWWFVIILWPNWRWRENARNCRVYLVQRMSLVSECDCGGSEEKWNGGKVQRTRGRKNNFEDWSR